MIKVNTKKVRSADQYISNSMNRLKLAEENYRGAVANINSISGRLNIENSITANTSDMFGKLYLHLSKIETLVNECVYNYEKVESTLLKDARKINQNV